MPYLASIVRKLYQENNNLDTCMNIKIISPLLLWMTEIVKILFLLALK